MKTRNLTFSALALTALLASTGAQANLLEILVKPHVVDGKECKVAYEAAEKSYASDTALVEERRERAKSLFRKLEQQAEKALKSPEIVASLEQYLASCTDEKFAALLKAAENQSAIVKQNDRYYLLRFAAGECSGLYMAVYGASPVTAVEQSRDMYFDHTTQSDYFEANGQVFEKSRIPVGAWIPVTLKNGQVSYPDSEAFERDPSLRMTSAGDYVRSRIPDTCLDEEFLENRRSSEEVLRGQVDLADQAINSNFWAERELRDLLCLQTQLQVRDSAPGATGPELQKLIEENAEVQSACTSSGQYDPSPVAAILTEQDLYNLRKRVQEMKDELRDMNRDIGRTEAKFKERRYRK